MGLRAIVMLSCLALASSKPGLFGPAGLGGIGDIGAGLTDINLGIIDTRALLEQLIVREGSPLTNVEIQSEQMKQVNSRLQAEFKFAAISNGNMVDCSAQIYAYVVGQNAQILNQSVLNCTPVSSLGPQSQFPGSQYPVSQYPGSQYPLGNLNLNPIQQNPNPISNNLSFAGRASEKTKKHSKRRNN